jgi:hypothetical protein
VYPQAPSGYRARVRSGNLIRVHALNSTGADSADAARRWLDPQGVR